ncbi:MAG: serine/threonine protein kinase [Clostridium sp.]|nr:serine/threonine protein kinase [Clostridium sp.]
MDLQMGDTIFYNWKIKKLIGNGNFGMVYEIEREEFGRMYHAAAKVISIPGKEFSTKDYYLSEGLSEENVADYYYSLVEDIINECTLMEQMKGDSHIVSYEDHIVEKADDGKSWKIYIRMELLTPLLTYFRQQAFAQTAVSSEKEVIRLGTDICSALETCQKFNVIHRDIKPENIFISEQTGNYKLGDFGISKTLEQSEMAVSQKGTQMYMAPEVYRGEKYSLSVDIYSLGLVMFRLLNDNRAPFLPLYPEKISFRDKELALKRRISGDIIPKPRNASKELGKIIQKACSYQPQERYSSPGDMKRELEKLLCEYEKEAQVISSENRSIVEKDGFGHTDADNMDKTMAVFHGGRYKEKGSAKDEEREVEEKQLPDGNAIQEKEHVENQAVEKKESFDKKLPVNEGKNQSDSQLTWGEVFDVFSEEAGSENARKEITLTAEERKEMPSRKREISGEVLPKGENQRKQEHVKTRKEYNQLQAWQQAKDRVVLENWQKKNTAKARRRGIFTGSICALFLGWVLLGLFLEYYESSDNGNGQAEITAEVVTQSTMAETVTEEAATAEPAAEESIAEPDETWNEYDTADEYSDRSFSDEAPVCGSYFDGYMILPEIEGYWCGFDGSFNYQAEDYIFQEDDDGEIWSGDCYKWEVDEDGDVVNELLAGDLSILTITRERDCWCDCGAYGYSVPVQDWNVLNAENVSNWCLDMWNETSETINVECAEVCLNECDGYVLKGHYTRVYEAEDGSDFEEERCQIMYILDDYRLNQVVHCISVDYSVADEENEECQALIHSTETFYLEE